MHLGHHDKVLFVAQSDKSFARPFFCQISRELKQRLACQNNFYFPTREPEADEGESLRNRKESPREGRSQKANGIQIF